MPRGPRISFDNALFHIINRGNARQEVFHEESDFQRFLKTLALYKNKFGFKMYHFCLMPNHIHLLWEIPKAEIFSKAMQGIMLSYTRFHHAKYKQVGHLWQGRFKSMIVGKEKYVMHLGGYIEKNPVRAGLVQKPEDWPWSSYKFYSTGQSLDILVVGRDNKKKLISLIDESPFYLNLGKNANERQKNYQNFIGAINKEDINKKKFFFRDTGVFGSDKFRNEMILMMKSKKIFIEPGKRGRPYKERD